MQAMLWRYNIVLTEIGSGKSDRTYSARNAYLWSFPGTTTTNCNVHVKTAAKVTNIGKLKNRTANQDLVVSFVDHIHMCNTPAMRDQLMGLVRDELMAAGDHKTSSCELSCHRVPVDQSTECLVFGAPFLFAGEKVYAEWFWDEYCTAPWKNWNYTASGTPGVSTDNNPLEGQNFCMATAAELRLQSLAWMMKTGVPRIISYFMDNCCPRNPSYCPSSTPAPIAEKAMLIQQGQVPFRVHIAPASAGKPARHMLFCSARDCAAERSSADVGEEEDNSIAWDDVNTYVIGKLGRSVAQTASEFIGTQFKLHLSVAVENNGTWSKPVCDCKGHWTSGVCSHSVFHQHLLNQLDLVALLRDLPKVPSGRPVNPAPAREMQATANKRAASSTAKKKAAAANKGV